MTSQDLLNLEYLNRATDSRIPEPDRREMLESLGYAMAQEGASNWILSTFNSVRGEALSDSMVLWLSDWIDSVSGESVAPEMRDLIVRLWRTDANPTVQARLFESAVTLDEAGDQSTMFSERKATDRIFATAIQGDADGFHLEAVIGLIDAILGRRGEDLLARFASGLNQSGLLQNDLLMAHILRRLGALDPEFRRSVEREFRINNEDQL